jgi:serine/threonine-protein kinase
MSKTRRWSGVALLVAGVAIAVLALHSATRDKDRDEAAYRAATQAAAEHLAAEQHAIEARVSEAAALQPLNNALDEQVDGPTLIDLFDNEDWWRPFRDEAATVRVHVGHGVLASRGGVDLGASDAEVVKAARHRQGVTSALVTVGGQPLLIAAMRLQAVPDAAPVLVFARPASAALVAATAAASAPPPAAGSPFKQRPVPLAGSGVLLLAGLVLVLVGPRRRAAAGTGAGALAPAGSPIFNDGTVTAAMPREPTLEFGTPPRPRPVADAQAALVAHTPPAPRPPIATGGNISARSALNGTGRVVQPAPPSPSGRALRAPTPPPLPPSPVSGPGAVFGRYRLVDRLGEGGMSEVFTAEATGVEGFRRTFVLKRLRPELAHDKEAVAQFIDEARLQASLVHSNIVPVFDFGVVAGEYFMTQEYILGRDLLRLLGRYYDHTARGLEPRLAYYVVHEVLLALSYAHSRRDKDGSPMGIVHRDVSPGNVILSLQGEVKLSDFGIVKSNRRVTKTQIGMVKGNANFMSPEQARGQAVDARSDLFSLGQVLYFTLTNELMYAGDNDLDVLYKAASGPTEDDLNRIKMLPDPAPQILEKALSFDPSQRFQSAAEFAGVLAAHTGGGKADAANLVQLLFGEELSHEAA